MKKLLFLLSLVLIISCGDKKVEESSFKNYYELNRPPREVMTYAINNIAPYWVDDQLNGLSWVRLTDSQVKDTREKFLKLIKDSVNIKTLRFSGDIASIGVIKSYKRTNHKYLLSKYSETQDNLTPKEISEYLFYKFIMDENAKEFDIDLDPDALSYNCLVWSVDPNNEFDYNPGKRYISTAHGPKFMYQTRTTIYKDGSREFEIIRVDPVSFVNEFK